MSAWRGIRIFCDFDGTITKNDISVALLRRYARWDERARTILKGNIGSKMAYREVESQIKASFDEMRTFARDEAKMDEGFPEFLRFVRNRGFSFLIVSDGFEFYIDEILKKHGLDAEFFAARLLEGSDGFHFQFPHSSNFCELCATCKLKIIRDRGDGFFRIFIGNGISDRCAIEDAEIVFAKSRLQDICYMKGVSFFPFDDFRDVLDAFSKNLKCFAIDFDGTIGWSYEGIIDAFLYAFRKLKMRAPPTEELTRLIGLPLHECFKNVTGDQAEKAVRIFRERYEKVFLKKTFLAVGAKETLKRIKEMGYMIAIISNKHSRFLRRLVEHFELPADLVVGEGDIVENGKTVVKPNPRVLEFVSDKLKLKKDEIAVVGDTEIDLRTAEDGNFIALCSPHAPPSYFKERGKVMFFLTCISDLVRLAEFYKTLRQF